MAEFKPILTIFEQAVQDALKKAGQTALKESNTLVPVDDADLKKTGRVNIDDLTVQVSYTGLNAVLQHENLDYQHPNGGQPKFLEQAVRNINPERIIADEMRRRLDG